MIKNQYEVLLWRNIYIKIKLPHHLEGDIDPTKDVPQILKPALAKMSVSE